MKAYVTSVGEKTTQICVEQLQRYGFEVELLDGMMPWVVKYIKFLRMAEADYEPCIRVDADIVVNELISEARDLVGKNISMAQFSNFDFYKNKVSLGQPVYYSPGAIHVAYNNIHRIDPDRPETSVWRFPEILKDTLNIDTVVAMNGFFQDQQTFMRAKQNKIKRKQMGQYDFELAEKLMLLK